MRRRGTGVAIVLYDKGRGIAREHRADVFKEFYRVRHERDKDVEGLGLGLSIVQRMGRLIDLQVQLDSREGHGTRATIHGLVRTTPGIDKARPIPTQNRLQGLRVCLVEDDASVLMATSALLEKWGCEVEGHSDGLNVVTECDIIIADYDLGTQISGSECIAAIRQRRGWDVPAMIMTGHEMARIRALVADLNISVLAKPVRPPELRAVLLEQVKAMEQARLAV